jgi:hypothetical protein
MSEKDKDKERDSFTLQANIGNGLRLALLAQFEFTNRLTKALVDSGALTAEAAEGVLLGTATALDKHAKPKFETAKGSIYFQLVTPHLESHASGLRGIAKKLGPKPLKAAS